MTITLRLFGELKHYLLEGQTSARAFRLELPEGTTAVQLILRLGIPYGGDEGLTLPQRAGTGIGAPKLNTVC